MNARRTIVEAYREWSTRPFDWNGACCLAWCGDAARRITGADPTVALRARYDSEFSCRRGMVEEGWKSIGDAAASLYVEIPVAMAKSGDWALCVDERGEEGLGVVVAAVVAIRGPSGMGQVPLLWARRAFRVE
ncbi:hypothetical protein RA307_23110 [Xanthobacteraceae bacterium Astr-EGSB]|uniref:DUF6950 family protein n=1 Tax=Astrobacterium formosum TaxID=3069710 RepID=UPI0027B3CC2A|nr:hypothetical protein [Xanthobacteraceae bacterium Astr-EGSB]